MSKPTRRYATFPLDCDAHNAANKKVREAMANDPDESDPKRKIEVDGTDEHYRTMWMDAYIHYLQARGEADGAYEDTPQKRRGVPVTTCTKATPPSPKSIPETANLTVRVLREGDDAPIPGAKVFISGLVVKRLTSDESGNAHFSGIPADKYIIDVSRDNYRIHRGEAVLVPNQSNVVEVKLSVLPKAVRKVMLPVQYFGSQTRGIIPDVKDRILTFYVTILEKFEAFPLDHTHAVAGKYLHPRMEKVGDGIFSQTHVSRLRLTWRKPNKKDTVKKILKFLTKLLGAEVDLTGDIPQLGGPGIRVYRSWDEYRKAVSKSDYEEFEKYSQ